MNFLRLRRTPKLAVPKHETDTFFVDQDGVFKKMAPDGTVSEVGGGGGSMPDPFVVTGTDPNAQTARIIGAPGQGANIFQCETDGVVTLLALGAPGGPGFQISPNPDNSTSYQFLDAGGVVFKDAAGNTSLQYTPSPAKLDLDPQNGQVLVLQESGKGYLRLAASSEPADADLAFNGCFILYIDGSDLKAKAKIGGDIVHATLGTFA